MSFLIYCNSNLSSAMYITVMTSEVTQTAMLTPNGTASALSFNFKCKTTSYVYS